MIKFQWKGPMKTGFASIFREVGPGEEFDVPEDLALGFAEHGLCVCLEPEKLAPLRAAAAAELADQDALRDAAGLEYAHPAAQMAAAERAAAAADKTPPAAAPAATETPATATASTPDPAPAAAPKRAAKTDPPTAAAGK